MAHGWQLVFLRFLMGLALGGLLPCVASVIRHNVPAAIAGNMLGYSTSAQYTGQVVGPLAGGFVGGHIGMRAVFFGTAAVMMSGAIYNWITRTIVLGTADSSAPQEEGEKTRKTTGPLAKQ